MYGCMGTGNDGTSLHTAIKIARNEDVNVVTCHFPCHFFSLLNAHVIQPAWSLPLHNLGGIIHGLTMSN